MMDTDFIVVSFGSYGMLVVWGPYGRFQSFTFTSLEPDA
jgi:hypothetical protein